jgi:hypothetical protein
MNSPRDGSVDHEKTFFKPQEFTQTLAGLLGFFQLCFQDLKVKLGESLP